MSDLTKAISPELAMPPLEAYSHIPLTDPTIEPRIEDFLTRQNGSIETDVPLENDWMRNYRRRRARRRHAPTPPRGRRFRRSNPLITLQLPSWFRNTNIIVVTPTEAVNNSPIKVESQINENNLHPNDIVPDNEIVSPIKEETATNYIMDVQNEEQNPNSNSDPVGEESNSTDRQFEVQEEIECKIVV